MSSAALIAVDLVWMFPGNRSVGGHKTQEGDKGVFYGQELLELSLLASVELFSHTCPS